MMPDAVKLGFCAEVMLKCLTLRTHVRCAEGMLMWCWGVGASVRDGCMMQTWAKVNVMVIDEDVGLGGWVLVIGLSSPAGHLIVISVLYFADVPGAKKIALALLGSCCSVVGLSCPLAPHCHVFPVSCCWPGAAKAALCCGFLPPAGTLSSYLSLSWVSPARWRPIVMSVLSLAAGPGTGKAAVRAVGMWAGVLIQ
eukprot:1159764-Pelagomonas_calceolata.AAC.8